MFKGYRKEAVQARVKGCKATIEDKRKYSNQNVPLTETGDLVGVIDVAQDETAFWHWILELVNAGHYDAGIQQISASTYRRMKGSAAA